MSHPLHLHRFGILGLALLLTSCIEVEDFGDYWKKSASNPCITRIANTHFFEKKDSEAPDTARILKAGPYTFLMLHENPAHKGGTLYRYEVKNDLFISYRLNEMKREEFLEKYPKSGVVITEETATIPVLNEKMIKLLQAIASKPDYWIETDHLPYNPSHLPGC